MKKPKRKEEKIACLICDLDICKESNFVIMCNHCSNFYTLSLMEKDKVEIDWALHLANVNCSGCLAIGVKLEL